MSYDVSLSCKPAGAIDAADDTREPLTAEDRQRVQRVLDRLLALDSGAEVVQTSDADGLRSFTIDGSGQLPYLEVEARSGMMSFSMASDPESLYRTLMRMAELFSDSGYTLFDHQLGRAIEPASNFEAFMPQFSSFWDSEAAFLAWMKAASRPGGVATAPPADRPGKRLPYGPILILLLVAVWGAYKLHNAGYF